jgi:A/G-specific adenine glycosylase
MLQQTRAAAAIPYYEEFLKRFPSVEELARASESEVLAAWSGLGYYSRARNIRKAAGEIVRAGGFPTDFEAIRALPGVGPYTAAAIASIAFGLPRAVLDGNVLRVIARVTGDSGEISAGSTRKRFQQVADTLLDARHPGEFNQAVMELGATVCLPGQPTCLVCPVAGFCEAKARGLQAQLPVKLRKAAVIEEEIRVLAIAQRGKVLMRQRSDGARRMAGFWELPRREDVPGLTHEQVLGEFRHTIVNHCYRVTVVTGSLGGKIADPALRWVATDDEPKVPFTTVSRKALRMLKKS